MSKPKSKYRVPKWLKDRVPEAVLDSSLFVFQFQLTKDQSLKVNLTDDIDIDFENLEEHLEEIPAQYVYWAAIYSELKSKVGVLEKKIETRRAIITKATLERFKENEIKLTDKQLINVIGADEKLLKLDAALLIAQKQTGKVYHMVEAIRIRSEHCRSLAGFKRQERDQAGQQT